MTTAVEGQGGFIHLVIDSGGAKSQEARSHPLHETVIGDIVGADHNHTPTATAADPVLGDGDSLSGAGAGGVDLGVGTTGADVFGELAVAHRHDAEEEAAVELVGFSLQLFA